MAFDYDLLHTELEGRILHVTIDAPPMNLIKIPLFRELRDFSNELAAASDKISVMVMRSADPDFFMAHYDVEALLGVPLEAPVEDPNRPVSLGSFHAMCERFRTMPVVTIAEIDGRVGGGGAELCASLDMRFGSKRRMVLNQMEVPLGILPGGSGTQRLPRLLGRGRAMEVVLGAVDIDATTAENWGWLNRALPVAELQQYVRKLALRIASFPPHAVRAAKASILAAGPDPTDGLLEEARLFTQTMQDPASREAMRRFLDAGGQTRKDEMRMEDLTKSIHERPL